MRTNEEQLKLVREIEAKYEEKFGKIQPCCRIYKDYCRCSAETKEAAKNRTTE